MNQIQNDINVLIPDGERVLAGFVTNCLVKVSFIKVHILSRKKNAKLKYSKRIASFQPIQEDSDDENLIDEINRIIENKRIDILFPVEIETIRLISKFIDRFKIENSKILVPDLDVFDCVENKWLFYKLLKANKLETPKSYDTDNWKKDGHNLDFPVLVKPAIGMGGFGIKKIEGRSDLENEMRENDKLIVQEYIHGFDIDMSVLSLQGKILAFTIQKGYIFYSSPYRAALGVEFLFEAELFEQIEKLIHILKWTGLAHIDLMYDTNSKKFKILEINPRAWGSIEASEKVGVNFPFYYCLASLGEAFVVPNYKFEKCVNNVGLIKILKSKLRLSQARLDFPEHILLTNQLADPLPEIIPMVNNWLKKLKRNKI